MALIGAWYPLTNSFEDADKLDIKIGWYSNFSGITGYNEIGKSYLYAGLYEKHYSHVFILNVLEMIYNKNDKIEAIKAILASLKDEAVILMASYFVPLDEEDQFDILENTARELRYDIKSIGIFIIGDVGPKTDCIHEFKVTRISQEVLSKKLSAGEAGYREVLISN
jgi:hypothetical protein